MRFWVATETSFIIHADEFQWVKTFSDAFRAIYDRSLSVFEITTNASIFPSYPDLILLRLQHDILFSLRSSPLLPFLDLSGCPRSALSLLISAINFEQFYKAYFRRIRVVSSSHESSALVDNAKKAVPNGDFERSTKLSTNMLTRTVGKNKCSGLRYFWLLESSCSDVFVHLHPFSMKWRTCIKYCLWSSSIAHNGAILKIFNEIVRLLPLF